MNKPLWIKIVAFCGATAVALGAFAAHGLADTLSPKMLGVFQTAVDYQFIHTLALLAVISLPLNKRKQLWVARSFLAGILLFSGSLYVLSITGISALGMVTPVGGAAFILGWVLLFFSVQSK